MEKSIVLRAPPSLAWRAITNVLAAIVWLGTSSAQASTVYVLRVEMLRQMQP